MLSGKAIRLQYEETRKIEIELSNKERHIVECTLSKMYKDSTTVTVFIDYCYQLPITHSLFKCFDDKHSDHSEVHKELLARGAKSIIIYKSEILTNVSVYALEASLKTRQFLTKFDSDAYDDCKLGVGYVTHDDEEYVADTILGYHLHVMTDRYENLVYNDIFDNTYEQSDRYIRKIRLAKE